jgi:hypothetical protein
LSGNILHLSSVNFIRMARSQQHPCSRQLLRMQRIWSDVLRIPERVAPCAILVLSRTSTSLSFYQNSKKDKPQRPFQLEHGTHIQSGGKMELSSQPSPTFYAHRRYTRVANVVDARKSELERSSRSQIFRPVRKALAYRTLGICECNLDIITLAKLGIRC